MKKKLPSRIKIRFRVSVRSTRSNGTIHSYSKTFTLEDGQSKVVVRTSKMTDEGYQSNYEVRENKNGTLYREVGSNSRDCDGSHSSFSEQELVSGSWVSIEDGQRDHNAEMSGY
ncbi:hypothetical protein [Psychromonas sp. SP041]|uniref:hypothetical protein n=1 Tax=Psychromonas sp. SP041 TaxID=1365007 RepID=UPI0010C7DCF2|nr:hypothetical protein [Psychromonas sp. SP041]